MRRDLACLWRENYIVVSIEMIAKEYRRLPLSGSYAVVRGGRVASAHFHAIRWWRPGGVPEDDLRAAVASAETIRPLIPDDLLEGLTPHRAFALLRGVFRKAAGNNLLVVTHDPSRRLDNLLHVIENWLGTDTHRLEVVNTAVLERARHLGLGQREGESAAEFYQRIASVEGGLPDLISCRREQEWGHPGLKPTDRLFPVYATRILYQHHIGGLMDNGSDGGCIAV